MVGKGGDGVEHGGAGADVDTVRAGDGDGRGGGEEVAESAGALELVVIERDQLGAGGREQDVVPGQHTRRVTRR